MDTALETAFRTFDLHIGDFVISPSYIQAFLIVVLIFLLIYSMAHVRHLYIHWSFKPAISWLLMGVVFALIVEGFLLLSGRTLVTEILGWKNAPQPLKTALDTGRSRLADVLGSQMSVPDLSAANPPKVEDVYTYYEALDEPSSQQFRSMVCKPN